MFQMGKVYLLRSPVAVAMKHEKPSNRRIGWERGTAVRTGPTAPGVSLPPSSRSSAARLGQTKPRKRRPKDWAALKDAKSELNFEWVGNYHETKSKRLRGWLGATKKTKPRGRFPEVSQKWVGLINHNPAQKGMWE